jgi:ABC-type branched-subunit amino acid transport system substrate-binding protein
MRSRRLTVVAVAALLACSAAEVLAQRPPPFKPGGASPPVTPTPPASTSTPTGVEISLSVGALLPLNGPGAWFGTEIKQGLELAAAELKPTPKRGAPTGSTETSLSEHGGPRFAPGTAPASPSPADRAGTPGAATPPAASGALLSTEGTSAAGASPASAGTSPAAAASTAGVPPSGQRSSDGTGAATASAETKKPATPQIDPVEPPDEERAVTLVIQAADVQPLDVKDAETEGVKLLGSGVVAIMTASPTPTLAVYPLAAGRDVLVLHAGLPTDRFPATSRTLLQLRPSVAARAEVLSAHAWERGIRRLALLSGGDPFGRAVRAAVSARWRQAGGQLVHEESLSLDASDLRARLRAAARTGPEAILLGYQGAALGEAARALRAAGYTGQILAADDDRAALLAGGSALDGALILSDAFVPVPGSRGARFARAFEAKNGHPPSRFAANAYEVATLLATAAERSAREGRGITGSRLRTVLVREGHFPSLYAGELLVREDGTIGRPLALFRLLDGKLAFESYVGLDGVALVPSPVTPKKASP